MINYFILTFQGFEYFKKKYKHENFSKSKIRIIDTGNQKISNFESYTSSKNLGCAGGWNLICYIGFDYLKLDKIIIGQDDTDVDEKELEELLKICKKWGKSISEDKLSMEDEQPPYEYKFPFNNKDYETSFLPITDRMKQIQSITDNKFLSENEITKFLIDTQEIKK